MAVRSSAMPCRVRSMQAEDDLLMLFLDRDEAHGRPGDGFADGSGVCRVVLAAHAVGRDELGGDKLDIVAVRSKQPRPVVRAGAGFHANPARRELRDSR